MIRRRKIAGTDPYKEGQVKDCDCSGKLLDDIGQVKDRDCRSRLLDDKGQIKDSDCSGNLLDEKGQVKEVTAAADCWMRRVR